MTKCYLCAKNKADMKYGHISICQLCAKQWVKHSSRTITPIMIPVVKPYSNPDDLDWQLEPDEMDQ